MNIRTIAGIVGILAASVGTAGADEAQGPFRLANRGAQVTCVYRGLPGDRAGLEVGDIIVAVNGRRIQQAEDLTAALRRDARPARVRVINVRNGQTCEIWVWPTAQRKIGIEAETVDLDPSPSYQPAP